MSSDLEKLSPFIGDECVPLNKTETLFQPINLDSFDDLEFTDDIFDLTVNTDGKFYKVGIIQPEFFVFTFPVSRTRFLYLFGFLYLGFCIKVSVFRFLYQGFYIQVFNLGF